MQPHQPAIPLPHPRETKGVFLTMPFHLGHSITCFSLSFFPIFPESKQVLTILPKCQQHFSILTSQQPLSTKLPIIKATRAWSLVLALQSHCVIQVIRCNHYGAQAAPAQLPEQLHSKPWQTSVAKARTGAPDKNGACDSSYSSAGAMETDYTTENLAGG